MQLDRHAATTEEPIAKSARMANAVLGVWLFASAFLWPHSAAHRLSDAAVGVIAAFVAVAALYVRPQLRFVNVALAVWMFASLWLLDVSTRSAAFANDLFVASLLFGFSVVPSGPRTVPAAHE